MKIDDDSKRSKLWILIIIILLTIYGFCMDYSVRDSQVKETTLGDTVISAVSSPMFVPTQIYGTYMVVQEKAYNPKLITLLATTTAYNSVEWQTDSTPCVGAGGYICGMKNVVACPRRISLGKEIFIDGVPYVCMDRLAEKYDDRFDLFFDKDLIGAKLYGVQIREISYYE